MLGPGSLVLFFLTLINLFNYLDRYILVALSPRIKQDLLLSDTQVGLLTTAFMLSYFLVSPVFGWLGDRGPRLRLMSFGVALWSVATAASGLAGRAWHLVAARLCVGVGEAAYGAISPSLLRDLFPKEVCGRVFSVFFMAIPVGSALGFLLGGFLERLVGWKAAFFFAGAPGLLLALGLLWLREPVRGAHDAGFVGRSGAGLSALLRELAGNPSYVLTVAGYCAYTFVVGGIAVWIPHYIERYLGVPASDGNMAFGAITVVAGFLGTMAGGAWADRWARSRADAYLKLSALSMFAAAPFYLWVLEARSFPVFCVATFVLEFFLFLSTSPVNAEIVNCVAPSIRASANAMGIFAIHLFGDAISPTLVGMISDRSDLRSGMMLFLVFLLAGGCIWAWKVISCWEAEPWPAGVPRVPRAQCHRGYHAREQENTIPAFRAAAAAGAEMVELDVRLSCDGVPVVIHDDNLVRIAGVERPWNRMPAAELLRLAGVPALRSVLQDPACASLRWNVELKADSSRERGLEMSVAQVVRECGAESRVIFSSFNPLALGRMARHLPSVPRALLATLEPDPRNGLLLRRMLLAVVARPHMLNFDVRYLDETLAERLRARRVPFAVWTVEDPEQARKCLELGAESIISPVPGIV